MKRDKIGLICSMLIWGSIGIFVKNIKFTSSQIALARAVIGSIFLIIFSLSSKRYISKEAIKSNLLILISCSICLAFNWIFLFQSYNYTSVSVATICYYLAPIIVMFLSPIIFKERLTIIKILCIVAAMIGMFCIAGIDSNLKGSNDILGVLYGLLAACLYALVVILNKFLKNIEGKDSSVVQLSIAAIFLIPYVMFTDGISFVGIDKLSIGLLLVVGIVHTGIAYLIYFSVIQRLPSQSVAIYSYVDPISAIIMSSIILRENMNLLQIIGGVLIIGSTFISEVYGKRKEKTLDFQSEEEVIE